MTENHGALAIHPIRKNVITPREMEKRRLMDEALKKS